jgi:putative heme-binding domain-containing protein
VGLDSARAPRYASAVMRPLLCLPLLAALALRADDPAPPHWIWAPGEPARNQTVYFSRFVEVGPQLTSAWLTGSADDVFRLLVNGQSAGNGSGADKPVMLNLTAALPPGRNWLGVMARNYEADAGLQLALDLTYADGRVERVVTDASWWSAESRPAGPPDPVNPGPDWRPVRVIAKLGEGRWGRLPIANKPGEATPPERIRVPPGFAVERLYSVPGEEQGSWVAMCLDGNGRLLVGDQHGKVYRFRPPLPERTLKPDDIKPLPFPAAGFAQGLLYAFNSLYMVGQVNREPGVFRFRDTNNDDQFDAVDKVLALGEVGHEHGAHNLALAPDGRRLYLVGGNLCPLPEPRLASRVPEVWAEDQLLPRLPSVNNLFADIRAPGGWVASFDRTGRDLVLEAVGLRNAYGLAFNVAGDLFTFDSDMEWDIGMPWYRPTRLLHVVPGADFGWRHGSGAWPDDVEDSFGSVADLGRGSPTGLAFADKCDFPHAYRGGLFLADWTYGRIFHAQLRPQGGSYTARFEVFLQGAPLPVTQLLFHPDDGAMYFITGGRRTQSGLYRVRWVGANPGPAPIQTVLIAPPPEQAIRRGLEDAAAAPALNQLPRLWSQLGHADRAVRHAARVALEHLPWGDWEEKALREANPQLAAPALLALARVRPPRPEFTERLRAALLAWPPQGTPERSRRAALRARQIAAIRHPHPAGYAEGWEAFRETRDPAAQRMLLELRAAAADPTLAAEGVERLGLGGRQPEQIRLGALLRGLERGWTPELRLAYFTWIARAFAAVSEGDWIGGDHARHFLGLIKDEALAGVPSPDRPPLRALLATPPPAPPPPPRPFVKAWTPPDLYEGEAEVSQRRHFNVGRQVYREARCAECHLLNGAGGASGPDLTGVSGKLGFRDLLRELLQPSAVVPESFALSTLTRRDGSAVTGQVVTRSETAWVLRPDPLKPEETVTVAAEEVAKVERSPLSAMPMGLLNGFTRAEILDLMAYLNAGGNPDDPAFE